MFRINQPKEPITMATKLSKNDLRAVGYIRDKFAETHNNDRATALTDEQVFIATDECSGDDDQQVAAIEAAINKKNNPLPDQRPGPTEGDKQAAAGSSVSISALTAQEIMASKFAAKFSKHTLEIFDKVTEQKAFVKGAGMYAYKAMLADFTEEEREVMPLPGSGPTDPKTVKERNLIEDNVKVTRASKKTGRQTTQTVSYWTELAARSERGKKITAELDTLEKKFAEKKIGARVYDIEKAALANALSTQKSATIKGWQVWRTLKDIARLLPDLTVEQEDCNDKGNYPGRVFWIYATGKAREATGFSIDQLVRFDVQKAADMGGTLDKLVDTLATGDTDPASNKKDLQNWEEFEFELSRILNYMGQNKNGKEFLNHLTGKGSKDVTKAFGELCDTVEALKPRFYPRYLLIKNEENLAENQAATAKLAAAGISA
jgi:hypothetical protein